MLNQQFCESCWAMTATDLVSIVWAQINNQTAELLSTQHACDCSSSGCCRGGWPEWVFQFIMANGGVASNVDYPYAGAMNSTCASVAKSKLKAKMNGWEKVPARSNTALMKAVAQHPVLVYIAGSSNDFINYSGGIFFGQCSGEIDHAVLVVGYSLVNPNSPVWIVKNTWGPSWGEGGYMRLPMLADGPGKCNMLSERGLYPTFYDKTKGAALCKLPINPCGGGTCVVTNGGARCSCPPGFVERLENDAPKCTVATPCDANPNPCGIGTCYNEFDGSYTCACPAGSVIGSRVEGSMTCVLGTFQSGLQTYTILLGDTCQTVASTFGFTIDFLQTKNPFLDCSQPLTPGYVILVGSTSTTLGCSAMDIVNPTDTCSTIAARNNITVRQLLGINPTLNCNVSLQRSQMLCVAPGALSSTSPLIRSCGRVYNVGPQDRCVDIARGFNISLLDFLWLNPGLRCDDNPINNAIAVCVAPLTTEFVTVDCSAWYTVRQADTCPLMANSVGLTVNQFLRLNPGLRCYPPYLQIGQKVCVNGTTQSMTKYPLSPNVIPYSVGVNDTLTSISQQYASMCPNNTFPADICSSNSFPDCTDQSITPSQMILIPCTRKIAGDICADSLPVCGADYVTYKSVCHAVLSFALPLEEDDVSKLDVPCACSGSLKYAHHDCIQRWCNEKGNTQCEICHHPFKEGYTAPPPPASPPITPGLVALQFRDGAGQLSHIVTFRDAVTGEELRFGLEDFASAPAAPEIPEPATVSCLKSLIIIVLLLIFARHFFALVLEASGDDDDVDEDSAEFTIFLMQLLGILLPCFILARALAAIHDRYRQ
ncbi:unnamed protein product, partial [Closterium sp. Naga37s-1]